MPVLQPERSNRLPSGSLWAYAPLKGYREESTVSQIVGKTDSLREGARTWDYMVKRKDSKGTEILVVDFTVTFRYCLWCAHCLECRRSFVVLHHCWNSEKICNLPRTSDQCSCYHSLSTADVTKQTVWAWAEDRGSGGAARARSCPCCPSLGRSLGHWYRAGYSQTHRHCPSHNTSRAQGLWAGEKESEKSKIYPWQPEGGNNHICLKIAWEWTTCSCAGMQMNANVCK